MSNDQLKLAFESFTRNVLQAAVNYIGGDEAVSYIWLYTSIDQNSISTMPFFVLQGRLLNPAEIAKLGTDMDPQGLSVEIAAAGGTDLLRAIYAVGEPPVRILTGYDNINGGFKASFDYVDDVPEARVLPPGKIMDQWIVANGGNSIYG